MEKNDMLINVVLFSPLVGIVLLLIMGQRREERIKWVALVSSLVTLAFSLVLLGAFDPAKAEMQLENLGEWFSLGNYTVSYYVGVDGLSILLVLLTAFIMPLAILFSLYHVKRTGAAVLLVPAAARIRHDWRLRGTRPVPLLRLLGSLAGADVLLGGHLGGGAAHLRRREILPLYDGGLDPDAARHPVDGQLLRHLQRHGDQGGG